MEAAELAGNELFADLSDAERSRIAELFQEARVLPGRRLAMEGEFGYRFFVILEGTAVVRVNDEEVSRLGPGDFFGEIALLEEERRTAEVEAISRMRIGTMMIWDFRELVRDMPEIGAKIEKAIAQRLGR